MNIFWTSFLSLLLFTTLSAEQRKPSGSRCLRYLFSYISMPLPGVPQYSVVGYVDDVLIIGYTNESGKAGPRATWMEKITSKEPQYWENTEKELEKVKKTLQDGFKKLMEQKNQTPGLHVLQLIHGCELREDGSGSSFQRFAFDAQNLTPATDPTADTKKQTECIQNLKNLLQIGEESLLRTVAPQTKVSQRKIGNHTFLTGYAYGFYPRDIEVKWVRNGVKIPWESSVILPNPDGTYQVQTTVEVQEGDDEKTYKYMVYHSSLPDTTTVIYGSHSLRYTFLSEPLPGVPQYSVVGYVDEVPIISFTSEIGRAEPWAPWMENITNKEPHFWEVSRDLFEDVKNSLNDSLRNLMEQKNQPPGLHVLQMMQGCELREDGSVKWFELFAYDGSNYTTEIHTASNIQDPGNPEELIGCMKDLKKLVKYGEESLQRRVAPQTMVSQRKVNDRTFLIGYAYGFYPRDIEVKWVRDAVEIPWESKELLPNPDGTYQVRTTVEVQEGDEVKTYQYHVTHSSLPESVTVTYGAQSGGLQWGALVAVAVLVPVVLVAVLVVLALVLRTKRTRQSPPPGGNNEEGLEMLPQNPQA